MKTILIISRYFFPDNTPRSFRTTELAKELSRQGHAVTVLTPGNPEHKSFASSNRIKIEDLGAPKWKEAKVSGSGIKALYRRLIKRGTTLLLEYPNLEYYFKVKTALKDKKRQKEKYDMLISIAAPFPIHWGVAGAWKANNNIADVWVADCGDPYMGGENDTFKKMFYFKYVEKWFCKKADYLSIPVKSAIPAYYPEFHDKIRIIPQGFNFDEIELAPYSPNPVPHFAYAGGLIPGRRDPRDFFEYLVNYSKPYKFYIYTRNIDLIKPYVERSGGRMEIRNYLPREELLFELSKLDFVVNFENVGKKQIPSKIIDYVITQRPILSVNSFNFDPEPVAQFLSGDYTNQLHIEDPEQYKIQNVVRRFLNLASN